MRGGSTAGRGPQAGRLNLKRVRAGARLERLQVDVLLEDRVLDRDLTLEQEGAAAGVALEELDLVRHRRREPRAADDPQLAAVELEFGDVLVEPDEVVDVGGSHGW